MQGRGADQCRKQRARPKVKTGSADTEGLADLAGPSEFWIGNTRADSTELKVEEVLNKAGVQNKLNDFQVVKVVCLTKEVNPRTKSWKVTVSARWKDEMLKPEMYPAGWTFRSFTPGYRKPEERARNVRQSSPAEEGRSLLV